MDGGTATDAPGPEPQNMQHRQLRMQSFADASEPYLEDAWLVDDVLPLTGLGVMFGAPGSMKTFSAIDLCLHIATGRTWRGRSIERCGVVYLSLEGGKPFANRLAAWARHHGVDADEPTFWRCAEPLDLRSTAADAERVIVAAKAAAAGSPFLIGLVVIDTLNRAMPGGNENAVEDMGRVIGHAQAIADALGCFVLIVHHSGKDAARGSRGHSSLLGAIDTELQVADGALTITKQRDGETGLTFGVDLERVEIGRTPKGRLVASMVAVEADVPEAKEKLSGAQQQALEALQEYVIETGTPCPTGPGWPEAGSRKVVDRDAFMAFLAGKQLAPEAKRRNEAAKRQIDALVSKGRIQINEGVLWII